jgi:hypothetical protein
MLKIKFVDFVFRMLKIKFVDFNEVRDIFC